MTPRIEPLGDSAVTITFGEGVSEALSTLVAARASAIAAADIMGVTDVVPSYATVGVFYDPTAIGFPDVRGRILAALDDAAQAAVSAASPVTHTFPVRYDGGDLDEVARRTGLSTSEVIRIHSEREYRVYVIGFVPGFAYLGTLDERLALPRRSSPRKRVPPGSVAIADQQTAVYPSPTPGGWHILGTTGATLFDPARERPALLSVGDIVRFEP